MKLSKEQLTILHNFKQIRESLVFTDNVWAATNSINDNSLLGYYDSNLGETFDEFGIANLPQFLQLLDTIDYDLDHKTLSNKFISIKDTTSGNTVKYNASAATLVGAPPDIRESFAKQTPELKFVLSAENYNNITTIGRILKSQRLYFIKDGDNLKIMLGANTLENSVNPYEIIVPSDEIDIMTIEKNEAIAIEKLIFLDDTDYTVSLVSKTTERGTFNFKSSVLPLDYFVSKKSDIK